MKQVWLIRHAKSSWQDDRQPDFDRPLNARGNRDAPMMQQWLAQQAFPAQWLWTSAAARAQETARFVSAAFELEPSAVAVQNELYLAAPDVLLDTVRSTPAECQCVGIVAHNPGLTQMAREFCAPEPAPNNLPTLGCVLFQSNADDWLDVAPHNTRLICLMTPKQLNHEPPPG